MAASATLELTEFFGGDVLPAIPGPYKARTAGGHVFDRNYDGRNWINPITGKASSAQLEWQGVVPGSISTLAYKPEIRQHLFAKDSATHAMIGEQAKRDAEQPAPPDDIPFN